MRFFYLIIALCYFIYILFSKALNKYYVGSTSNIDERLKKHLSNHKGYTSMAKDWEIVYTESFDDRTSALVREKQIKRWKSRKMIQHLIKEKEFLAFSKWGVKGYIIPIQQINFYKCTHNNKPHQK